MFTEPPLHTYIQDLLVRVDLLVRLDLLVQLDLLVRLDLLVEASYANRRLKQNNIYSIDRLFD